MKVSIIVPVYNAEKLLDKCITSALKQNYQDIEVILVDDGSTDNSPNICDRYAREEERVVVLHQQNSGQSIARNAGLSKAIGDYIFFLDADDSIGEECINTLVDIAQNGHYDIVCSQLTRITENRQTNIKPLCSDGIVSKQYDRESIKRYHSIKTKSVFGYLCGKLYKSEFIKRHNLIIDDIREVFMEDQLFNLKAFSFSPKYYYTNTSLYNYHIIEESTSNSYVVELRGKLLNLIHNYDDFLNRHGSYKENLDLFIPLYARVFCWAIVKNIPYRGLSYKKILGIIQVFAKDNVSNKLIKEKVAMPMLRKLPSVLERVFYCFCFWSMRLRLYHLLAAIFWITYPLSQLYIKQSLRR